MIVSTHAIVLNKKNYSDSSLICDLFSKDSGKVTIIAKGAKSIKNPLGAFLQPLNYIECIYYYKSSRNIQTLKEASIINKYYAIENDYKKITQWMLDQFKQKNINILDVFHCPHGPNSTCDCRKPNPGMFIKAKNKHNTDMKKSWMIGDKEVDVIAANSAGIDNTILVRSGHRIDKPNSNAKIILDSILQIKQIIKS